MVSKFDIQKYKKILIEIKKFQEIGVLDHNSDIKNHDKTDEVRKIIHQSMHRGCKEMDILLGEFISKNWSKFSQDDISLYQDLLLEDDLEIYNAIISL